MAPSVQLLKVWLTRTSGVPCSNTAKTRNPLKLAGVPQTTGPISAASGPKFTVLWGHVKEILLLNKFFPIVDTCLCCKDIARQSCAMVPRWRFFGDFLHPVAFSADALSALTLLVGRQEVHPACEMGGGGGGH